MKRFLLIPVIFILALSIAIAGNNDKKKTGYENGKVEFQKKSEFTEPANFVPPGGFSPGPEDSGFPRYDGFNAINVDIKQPVLSTGYYFVDSEEDLGRLYNPKLRPDGGQIADTTFQAPLWRRVVKGPNIHPKSYWEGNQEGLAYFRNPFDPDDSTDDAYAGPIPLGLRGGFYFNGIRYDSFYVTTNGALALSNRRYFYDDEGNRYIPEDRDNCYDPMSMDWFVEGEREKEYLRDDGGNIIYDDDGNPTILDGLNDPVPDRFGHLFSVLGFDPNDITNPRTDAMLARGGGNLSTIIPDNRKTAIVAPFWGDLHLSQYWDEEERADDWGRCYYKRSIDSDSLIVAFFNIAPKGGLQTYSGNYTGPTDARPGENDYISADASVVLNRADSSITFNYIVFIGITNSTFRPVPANDVFRCNTSAGVRGFGRHINYGKYGAPRDTNSIFYPWVEEYEQFTHYFASFCDPNARYPETGTAVRFKQWQNTLRVVDIQYRVRKLDPEANLDFTEVVPTQDVDEYELLAGNDRLGAIQPVASIQNLTNNIQGPDGVNYVKQDLEFRARFRIENQITDRIVYNRIVDIDELCMSLLAEEPSDSCDDDPNVKIRLAKEVEIDNKGNYKITPMPGPEFRANGYDGVPPYKFTQVWFPPFLPNEFIDNHIGRHRTYIIADPTNPRSQEKLADDWPFDDTTSVRMFVMNRLTEFNDDVTEYHIDGETDLAIPSAYKWVNFNAQAVSSEFFSHHPLPPRGEYFAENRSTPLYSPAIHMNRVQFNRAEPKEKWADEDGNNGDELRSFPIDMRGRFNSVLSISVQRTLNQKGRDWVRGWMDEELVGPEPRIIRTSINDDPAPFAVQDGGMWASNTTDAIAVEFAKPSDDGLNEITNIPNENWRYHPGKKNADGDDVLIEDMSALRIFGAGGYIRGFLKDNPDSVLTHPDPGLLYVNGLRADPYDDGIDFEFKKYQVMIPDTFIKWQNEGAKNFRFRVKVLATADGPKNILIPSLFDDFDDFLVDNIRITFPTEVADLEVNSVKVIWPYTIAPASQASNIPIRVNISNNSSSDSPTFAVKVKIFRTAEVDGVVQAVGDPIYCRVENIGNLNASTNMEIDMPAWNARKSQTALSETYRIVTNVLLPEQDLNPLNDTTYTDFTLNIGDQFAYDPPVEDPTNSVSGMVGPGGRGLNLFGSNYGGGTRPFDYQFDRAGAYNGSGSGQIAMKFELLKTDTIFGYRAYFGSLSTSVEYVAFRVYDDMGNQPGRNIMGGSTILAQRAVENGQVRVNDYVTYLLPQPLILPRGVYWLAVNQLSTVGFELGASASRSGTRLTLWNQAPSGALGPAGIQLYIHKEFRTYTPQGNYVNNNFFAYENSNLSGAWVKFTPGVGNIAYPHFDHNGFHPSRTDLTGSNGTWIPMIRPYLGLRAYGTQSDEYEYCPDDIPVEITSFDGETKDSGIELFWETASETNNYGFYVERRKVGDEMWQEINFVSGSGNSNVMQRYNYFDKQVVPNTTYQYRIKQIDFDGTQSCATSNIVTLTYTAGADVVLGQNKPNPFDETTTITFTLPYEQKVKFEILDVFGNVVKTLENGTMSANTHTVIWNGLDEAGRSVSNGTYIYRLTAGETIKTGKMMLVK